VELTLRSGQETLATEDSELGVVLDCQPVRFPAIASQPLVGLEEPDLPRLLPREATMGLLAVRLPTTAWA